MVRCGVAHHVEVAEEGTTSVGGGTHDNGMGFSLLVVEVEEFRLTSVGSGEPGCNGLSVGSDLDLRVVSEPVDEVSGEAVPCTLR